MRRNVFQVGFGTGLKGFVGVTWQEGPRTGERGHPKSPTEGAGNGLLSKGTEVHEGPGLER